MCTNQSAPFCAPSFQLILAWICCCGPDVYSTDSALVCKQHERHCISMSLMPVWPAASCVTKGQTLRRGACAQFVNYFVGNSECSSRGQAFIDAVKQAPQPLST